MTGRKIRRCPHCAGKAFVRYRNTDTAMYAFIQCGVCGAQTRLFPFERNNDELLELGGISYNAVSAAIEAWNRRVRKRGQQETEDDYTESTEQPAAR